jgi:hypothetical protein
VEVVVFLVASPRNTVARVLGFWPRSEAKGLFLSVCGESHFDTLADMLPTYRYLLVPVVLSSRLFVVVNRYLEWFALWSCHALSSTPHHAFGSKLSCFPERYGLHGS